MPLILEYVVQQTALVQKSTSTVQQTSHCTVRKSTGTVQPTGLLKTYAQSLLRYWEVQ